MNCRKYLAVSITLTGEEWSLGMPLVLRGRRTSGTDEHSFDRYTYFADEAEVYSIADCHRSPYYPSERMQLDEPQDIDSRLCKRWCKYDTVLIKYEDYIKYCNVYKIPTARS